jgi:hypothetical protein
MTNIRFPGRRRAAAGVVVGALVALAACSTDDLLRSNDPDLIAPGDFDSPAGAQALKFGAIGRFADAFAANWDYNPWLFGGLLVDEYSSSSTFTQNDETDKRQITVENTQIRDLHRNVNRVRTATNQAIQSLVEFSPDELTDIGEMLFMRGFAEMTLAQDFCNGIALSDASGDEPVPGEAMDVVEVFQIAAATFDSAMTVLDEELAKADPDDRAEEIYWAAQVGKGRALRSVGDFAGAAAAVVGVPNDFAYLQTVSAATGRNIHWSQINSARRFTIGDSLEGNSRAIEMENALPFFTAQDPRVLVRYTVSTSGADTTRGQDGLTFSRTLRNIYADPDGEDPIEVVNGKDAQLIRAEALLDAGDAGWLGILNTMRADVSNYPPAQVGTAPTTVPLPALTDPGTDEGRVRLLYREKAFWTFGRGQRLNDLRILVRVYGYPEETVFPTGPEYYKGGQYGTDKNLPIPQAEENNPIEGSRRCTDREA